MNTFRRATAYLPGRHHPVTPEEAKALVQCDHEAKSDMLTRLGRAPSLHVPPARNTWKSFGGRESLESIESRFDDHPWTEIPAKVITTRPLTGRPKTLAGLKTHPSS
jgi:hypothetical protein